MAPWVSNEEQGRGKCHDVIQLRAVQVLLTAVSTLFLGLKIGAEFSWLYWELDKLLFLGHSLLGEWLVSWAAVLKLVSEKKEKIQFYHFGRRSGH